jgi:hypothetical protein
MIWVLAGISLLLFALFLTTHRIAKACEAIACEQRMVREVAEKQVHHLIGIKHLDKLPPGEFALGRPPWATLDNKDVAGNPRGKGKKR